MKLVFISIFLVLWSLQVAAELAGKEDEKEKKGKKGKKGKKDKKDKKKDKKGKKGKKGKGGDDDVSKSDGIFPTI